MKITPIILHISGRPITI